MLLLLVLAGLWAAVLIPATRGTRDAAYDGRSMQGFSTAMRVLSRRNAPADSRYIMVPTAATTSPTSKARRQQQRRRAVLARLVWACGLTLAAAVLLGGPWPAAHLLCDLALVGYAVRLRRLELARATDQHTARRAELDRREAAHRAAYEAAHPRPEPVAERPLVREVQIPAYPAGEARRAANE